MVHKTKTYEYASYEEIRDSGQFDTPENCLQYLLDMKILPTHRMCTSCDVLMVLGVCPTTKYGDGYCWTCTTCSKTCSVRVGSILESSKVTAREFIDMLGQFSYGKNVSVAAQHANVGENTCRRLYNEMQERIAEDIATRPLIGGPMTVVECDEAKFGKSKYDQGRYVEGSWVMGGIQRGTDHCFLVCCPNSCRGEAELVPIIRQYVRPGTLIVTDMWQGYTNLTDYGYLHEEVNHSRNFVDPVTGAHTNTIEGTWTHAKNFCLRTGGRRSTESLSRNLTEFMWRKQKGLSRSIDSHRILFSREFPRLLNYRNYGI